MPGDAAIEDRIRSYIRWNAMAMVVKANRKSSELGGHIATFASAATLYDVGFEVSILAALTIVCISAGAWLFSWND